MRIEHFALQVPDPVGFAAWYGEHLGTTVLRSTGAPTFTHFLATAGNGVVLEIYRNDKAPIPDYPQQDPLVVHLAFVSESPESDLQRLVAAGATLQSGPTTTAAGDTLVMLRDPWGIPIQLCRRAQPFFPQK